MRALAHPHLGEAGAFAAFGNWHAGSISGTKYHDLNANGSKDSGEGPLSGFTFYVDQGDGADQDSDPHAVSAADGTWTITRGSRPARTRSSRSPRPVGRALTPASPCAPRRSRWSPAPTRHVAAFGNYTDQAITGSKYEDLDASGSKDPGEGPLSGFTFYVDQGTAGYQDSDPHAIVRRRTARRHYRPDARYVHGEGAREGRLDVL